MYLQNSASFHEGKKSSMKGMYFSTVKANEQEDILYNIVKSVL